MMSVCELKCLNFELLLIFGKWVVLRGKRHLTALPSPLKILPVYLGYCNQGNLIQQMYLGSE